MEWTSIQRPKIISSRGIDRPRTQRCFTIVSGVGSRCMKINSMRLCNKIMKLVSIHKAWWKTSITSLLLPRTTWFSLSKIHCQVTLSKSSTRLEIRHLIFNKERAHLCKIKCIWLMKIRTIASLIQSKTCLELQDSKIRSWLMVSQTTWSFANWWWCRTCRIRTKVITTIWNWWRQTDKELPTASTNSATS